MARNKKKWIIIGTILLLMVTIISVMSYYASRVHWKYNDKWIIGQTKEEIIERYGEFDRDFSNTYKGYFLYRDDKSFMGLSGNGVNMYYYIIFDENDIAIKVYVGGTTGG